MQINLPDDLVSKLNAKGAKTPEDIIKALAAGMEPKTETPPAVAPKVENPTLPANVISLADFQALSLADFQALSAKVDGVVSGLATVTASISAMQGEFKSAVNEAKTEASKAVAKALAHTGQSAPIGGGATDAPTEPPKAKGAAFVELVQAGITKGLSKSQAIDAAIKANPDAYTAWLKSGNTKTI